MPPGLFLQDAKTPSPEVETRGARDRLQQRAAAASESYFEFSEAWANLSIRCPHVARWGRSLLASPLFHRLDEFAVGYSLGGCSPALPASASPTGFIFILPVEAVKHRRRRLGSCAVEVSRCVATDKRFYPASALKSRFGATCRPSPARPARDDVPTLASRHIAGDFFCRN